MWQLQHLISYVVVIVKLPNSHSVKLQYLMSYIVSIATLRAFYIVAEVTQDGLIKQKW